MKRRVANLLRPCIPALGLAFSAFFDRKYIQGQSFDNPFVGYRRVLRAFWIQRVLGFNRHCPWPISHATIVSNYDRIHFHPNDLGNFNSPGCYFQNFDGDIYIGRGTYIAPNVGIITSNHVVSNLDGHTPGQNVVLGDGCWIGMNPVMLPGVMLGKNTVTDAGSVVTRSIPADDFVTSGNPATILSQS